MEQRIQKLKQQLAELKQWKIDNSIQQLPFNPPVNTETVMHIDHFVMQQSVTPLPQNTSAGIEVEFDGDIFYLLGWQY